MLPQLLVFLSFASALLAFVLGFIELFAYLSLSPRFIDALAHDRVDVEPSSEGPVVTAERLEGYEVRVEGSDLLLRRRHRLGYRLLVFARVEHHQDGSRWTRRLQTGVGPIFLYIWLLGVLPLFGLAVLSDGELLGLGPLLVGLVLAGGYRMWSRGVAQKFSTGLLLDLETP
jgi:hypothetical protein